MPLQYEIVRPLGAGGMAEVFEANLINDDGFRRRVAIKRVLSEYCAVPHFAELFRNEARVAGLLHHENVVPVVASDRDADGRLFIVMEFIEGCDLSALLKAGAPPLPIAIYVATCVLRGLAHAHDLTRDSDGKPFGIVHRDIKPSNIMIGHDGTVRVADFGIAKATAATGATASGNLVGTLAYMSPEQAHGSTLDGRSDLFGVGIMLWEMLCGRSLFGGGTQTETFGRVLHQPLYPPSQYCPDVPPELDAIVMTLLQRDRDQRYQHARDCIRDLDACSASRPELAAAAIRARDLLCALIAERVPGAVRVRSEVRPSGGVRSAAHPKVASAPQPPAAPMPIQARPPTLTAPPRPSPRTRRPLGAIVLAVSSIAVIAVTLVVVVRGGDGPASPADAGLVAAPVDAGSEPTAPDAPSAEPVLDAAIPDAAPAVPGPRDAGPTRPHNQGQEGHGVRDKVHRLNLGGK